jgi:hypothetical protein
MRQKGLFQNWYIFESWLLLFLGRGGEVYGKTNSRGWNLDYIYIYWYICTQVSYSIQLVKKRINFSYSTYFSTDCFCFVSSFCFLVIYLLTKFIYLCSSYYLADRHDPIFTDFQHSSSMFEALFILAIFRQICSGLGQELTQSNFCST